MNEPKPLPSETKLVERWRKQLQDVGGWDNELAAVPAGGVRKMIEEFATALASLADELRLAREALKQAAEMLQASLPYWQTDERGNGPDCTPLLQAILNANAALKKPR